MTPYNLGFLPICMLNNAIDSQDSEITENSCRPLKICLLGYRSNPYSGGQGIYIRYLSKALTDAGHQVDVISGPPYPQLDASVKLIKLPSLNLYEVDNHVTALRPRHLLSYTDLFEWFSMLTGGFPEPYTFGRRLKQYFDKHQPNYDIVHDNQSLCFGTLHLQQQSVPLITTIHHPITSDFEIALRSATTWKSRLLIRRWHSFIRMQKKVVAKLNHIVTVSQASQRDIAKAFDLAVDDLNVVHNGIDTQTFRPLPDVERIPYRVMVTASADQPLKGLQYLLRAMAELIPNYPDIHLVILGKLKEDGDTEKLMNELNIHSHLTFVSGIETEELVRLYAQASIVVVPSVYEGFGLPAGEAMACAVPVISTNGGALPEVVGDSGLIVPVRDHGAIADALDTLFNDSSRRRQLSKSGRERIVNSFSWKVTASNMVSLYEQVLKGSRV
ncbi:MAG: glycosyltransferase family 4 protein [Pseudomonadales bacterium]|nr:glycosyltransferase family 4 protein [Pseudomonadales bacterium]